MVRYSNFLLDMPTSLLQRLLPSLLLLCILVGGAQAIAQVPLELGISGGLSRYEGDLAPQGTRLISTHNGASWGVFARAPLGSRIMLRGMYHHSNISGDDAHAFDHYDAQLIISHSHQ